MISARLRAACAALIIAVMQPVAANETAAVAIPLQAYLDGHATGRIEHFRRAFAADGVLLGWRDGRYSQSTAEDYIRRSASGRPAADEALRGRWIRSIHVTGRVATAVIELDYPGMKAMDHMALLKFEDGWRIVAKTYDAVTPSPVRSTPLADTPWMPK